MNKSDGGGGGGMGVRKTLILKEKCEMECGS